MFKKGVLLVGLVVSMSMDAAPSVQIAANTYVASAIRWLSSGKKESNIAAIAIAVCVAKSGFDIISWPFRSWKNAKKEHASTLKFADLVKKVDVNEEALKNLRTSSGLFATVSTDYMTKTDFAPFGSRIEKIEGQVSQLMKCPVVQPVEQSFGGRLSKVENQVEQHEGQIVSATKKADNAYHLTQKVGDLEEKVTTLMGQVKQLQGQVFPKQQVSQQ